MAVLEVSTLSLRFDSQGHVEQGRPALCLQALPSPSIITAAETPTPNSCLQKDVLGLQQR